eukprot:TRINITY_DN869_c0_g1_i2.p1 TRINITY_DN869_c0_g1~~TRINITY_DN869_c0_g1_i2.p1  ORF type:complete len:559 (-),score=103.67 TRINITY_DN869_c0_g1_i2:772-2448(-)
MRQDRALSSRKCRVCLRAFCLDCIPTCMVNLKTPPASTAIASPAQVEPVAPVPTVAAGSGGISAVCMPCFTLQNRKADPLGITLVDPPPFYPSEPEGVSDIMLCPDDIENADGDKIWGFDARPGLRDVEAGNISLDVAEKFQVADGQIHGFVSWKNEPTSCIDFLNVYLCGAVIVRTFSGRHAYKGLGGHFFDELPLVPALSLAKDFCTSSAQLVSSASSAAADNAADGSFPHGVPFASSGAPTNPRPRRPSGPSPLRWQQPTPERDDAAAAAGRTNGVSFVLDVPAWLPPTVPARATGGAARLVYCVMVAGKRALLDPVAVAAAPAGSGMRSRLRGAVWRRVNKVCFVTLWNPCYCAHLPESCYFAQGAPTHEESLPLDSAHSLRLSASLVSGQLHNASRPFRVRIHLTNESPTCATGDVQLALLRTVDGGSGGGRHAARRSWERVCTTAIRGTGCAAAAATSHTLTWDYAGEAPSAWQLFPTVVCPHLRLRHYVQVQVSLVAAGHSAAVNAVNVDAAPRPRRPSHGHGHTAAAWPVSPSRVVGSVTCTLPVTLVLP